MGNIHLQFATSIRSISINLHEKTHLIRAWRNAQNNKTWSNPIYNSFTSFLERSLYALPKFLLYEQISKTSSEVIFNLERHRKAADMIADLVRYGTLGMYSHIVNYILPPTKMTSSD